MIRDSRICENWYVLRSLIVSLVLCICIGSVHGEVGTYFTHHRGSFSNVGDHWYQGFTLKNQTKLVLRFTSDYEADCAIFNTDQLHGFTSGSAISGYAVFSGQFGTESVTLAPGTYYVGIRNGSEGSNSYSMELDKEILLQATASESYHYEDICIQGNEYVNPSGGTLWHPFSIQTGFRYFIDGCNSGMDVYIIPENELAVFRSGNTFNYYADYSGQDDSSQPGLSELKLTPGNYFLAVMNEHEIARPITYTMERWRVLPVTNGGGLDLAGPASWKIKGSKLLISAGKVVKQALGGESGSLRLRLGAVRNPFTGGSITGYVIGMKILDPLSGGYQYPNIGSWVPLKRPPAGRYYTILTLEEYTSSGWVRRDHLAFSRKKKF